MALKKIISGGQTGADYAGLLAGREMGLETGGTAPKGWRICLPDGTDGSNPGLEKFGLIQHSSREYPPRTRQNVIDSDGTVWFGYDKSPGGKLTARTCASEEKPFLINPTPENLRSWVALQDIEVLNVAGNRASEQNPDIEDKTYSALIEAFGQKEQDDWPWTMFHAPGD